MERLDPSVAFLPVVTKQFGKDNVIVVKDAEDGQPIRRWYKKWKPAVWSPPLTGVQGRSGGPWE
jgi:hypothetical protein